MKLEPTTLSRLRVAEEQLKQVQSSDFPEAIDGDELREVYFKVHHWLICAQDAWEAEKRKVAKT